MQEKFKKLNTKLYKTEREAGERELRKLAAQKIMEKEKKREAKEHAKNIFDGLDASMDLAISFKLHELAIMDDSNKKLYITKVLGDNKECTQIVQTSRGQVKRASEIVNSNKDGI